MNKKRKEKHLLEEAYSQVLGEQSESKAPKGDSFDSEKNYKPSGVDAGSDGSGGRYRRIRINKPGRSKETHGGRGVQDEEIKVGSMITTNYGEVVHIDEIDTDSDMKGRPVYIGTDKDGGDHILYPDQIHAVSDEEDKLESVELGGDLYEVGAPDPSNESELVTSIVKHANGYMITTGQFSSPEDFTRKGPDSAIEAGGYALTLDGKLMREDDLEDGLGYENEELEALINGEDAEDVDVDENKDEDKHVTDEAEAFKEVEQDTPE